MPSIVAKENKWEQHEVPLKIIIERSTRVPKVQPKATWEVESQYVTRRTKSRQMNYYQNWEELPTKVFFNAQQLAFFMHGSTQISQSWWRFSKEDPKEV
jgi:hypothetical protein